MKKIVLFLAFIISFSIPAIAFADNDTTKKTIRVEDFEITVPEKDNTITSRDNFVITGNAKKNDKIVIDVYNIKRNRDNELLLKRIVDSYNIDVDSLEIFAQEINLKQGENMIEITLNRNNKTYTFIRSITYDKELNIIKALEIKKIV